MEAVQVDFVWKKGRMTLIVMGKSRQISQLPTGERWINFFCVSGCR